MANPNDRAGNADENESEPKEIESERSRGYDEAGGSTGDEKFEDIDPDSAESDIDRDDSIDEI